MIPRILLSTVLVGLCAAVASAQYTDVRPFGYDLMTSDAAWADPTTVYVAARANPQSGIIRSAILKSVNEGDSWVTITREGVSLNDLEVLSTTSVVAVGMSASCGCAVVQRTVDAGSNWTEETFVGIDALLGVDFVNATTGYAVGTLGAILKTTNAGANWTNIGPGPTESVTFTDVSFSSPQVGYAIGLYTANPEPNRVYKTTDAGVAWTKILDQGNPDINKPVFYGIWATSDNTLFLAGREQIRAIFRSTDGGATWRRAYSGLPVPQPFTMATVEFVSDSVGFAAGDYGTMLRTTNGGLTWSKEDPGTTQGLTGLGFRDRNTGIVGGFSGELLKRAVAEVPTIDVDSEALNFGAMTSGSKDLDVVVSPSNSAGLVITGIDVLDPDDAGFELLDPLDGFPIELELGEEQTVTVRFTPRAGLNGRVFGSLIIKTNDARVPNKTIGLVADASTTASSARIEVSLSNIDFGRLFAGTSRETSFQISAGSDAVLEIDSLWIVRVGPGAEAYSVVSPTTFPINVTQGQPLTVTVRYAPTTPTSFDAAGELAILSNDQDDTELRVPLTGSAIADPSGIEDEALRSSLGITMHPNPATSDARVSMSVPAAGHLMARLYDSRGVLAATLADAMVEAGTVTLALDAGMHPSGVYTLVVALDKRVVTTRIAISR